jgi:ribosomal protein L19E
MRALAAAKFATAIIIVFAAAQPYTITYSRITVTPITDKLEEIYKAIKAHVSHVQALLSAARINHLPVQGISDAKARTVKIAETYLKTRQMHVASI